MRTPFAISLLASCFVASCLAACSEDTPSGPGANPNAGAGGTSSPKGGSAGNGGGTAGKGGNAGASGTGGKAEGGAGGSLSNAGAAGESGAGGTAGSGSSSVIAKKLGVSYGSTTSRGFGRPLGGKLAVWSRWVAFQTDGTPDGTKSFEGPGGVIDAPIDPLTAVTIGDTAYFAGSLTLDEFSNYRWLLAFDGKTGKRSMPFELVVPPDTFGYPILSADNVLFGTTVAMSDEKNVLLVTVATGKSSVVDSARVTRVVGSLGSHLVYAAFDGNDWTLRAYTAGEPIVDLVPKSADKSVFLHLSPTLLPDGTMLLWTRKSEDAPERDLWRTDGTVAGTKLVKTLPCKPDPFQLDGAGTIVGALGYFGCNTAENGDELWRTDGTDAGTYRVSDAAPGPASGLVSVGDSSTIVEGKLTFLATNTEGTPTLWTSDGTAAGTKQLSPETVYDGLFVRAGSSYYVGQLNDLVRIPLTGGPGEPIASDPPFLGPQSLVGGGSVVAFAARGLETNDETEWWGFVAP